MWTGGDDDWPGKMGIEAYLLHENKSEGKSISQPNFSVSLCQVASLFDFVTWRFLGANVGNIFPKYKILGFVVLNSQVGY